MTHSLGRPLAIAVGICVALAGTTASAQDNRPSLADITEAWLSSPHGDRTSEAFIHWNEDGEIPGTCAVCHPAPVPSVTCKVPCPYLA